MADPDDNKFMRRCLDLASCAEGMTFPNPLVGSVIVYKGRIIGEGYHLKAGQPHAEVNAIRSVTDTSKLKESILYVNLEPCSHYGKTPPCADLIIANQIPRVVIGTIDTSEKVGGKGAERLRKAGIEVTTGVLEEECRWINRRFFTFNEKKRPYITIKWAESADGYIDTLRNPKDGSRPNWISGKPERVLVHKWRSEEQAILAGAGTIRADHPMLNVREWTGNNPVRVVLSSSGDFPAFGGDSAGEPFIVFTGKSNLEMEGARIVQLDGHRPASLQVADFLYREGIQSLFIEGGAAVINHFISNGLWDEARVFRGSIPFNRGIKAPSLTGTHVYEKIFRGSTLRIYLNQ